MSLPEPSLRRLPWYLAYVKLLRDKGVEYVSSTQISKELNVDASQIAKDLSFINISGKTRVGYEVASLVDALEQFLGFGEKHKAVIFVPSPNVTEDHQTHNAMALVGKGAALMVTDAEAPEKLMKTACSLVHSPDRIASLEKNIAPLAMTDAAGAIVDNIYKLLG